MPEDLSAPAPPPGEFDDEDFAPFPRQHRRQALRWVGLVVAMALLVASVGAGVGVLLVGGPSGPAVRTGPVTVTPIDAAGALTHGTSVEMARAAFTVTNAGSVAHTPVCTVHVLAHDEVVGSVTVHAERQLAPGDRVTAAVTVPLVHTEPAAALDGGWAACT